MSRKTFQNRDIFCPICSLLIGKFTRDNLSKVIRCKSCKSQFQMGKMSDWQKEGSSKKGIAVSMGLSATVDNPVDRNFLKKYN